MSGKLIKQFVDTNVVVYAYDLSAGKRQKQAESLLDQLWQSRTGCLSIQVLQEFYNIVTRKLTHSLSSRHAYDIVADLGQWYIHQAVVADVLGAIQLQQRYQLSFWDALIVRSAAQSGCTILWSEDLNNGQVYEGVEVRNPFI
ncbi:MAG TPA: PIN domain-containing protein [Chloroflexota bacterium]|nr:PIN domain-containing protein [Chloroflexota bacterium]HUM72351.1 PIN domain-containing protein [Chloroflexota bacterium]